MHVKNRDLLIEFLQDFNDFIKLKNIKCPPLYLLGGSGCILADYLQRATIDFNILDMNYPLEVSRLFRVLGQFNLMDLFVTPVAPGFEFRATLIDTFDSVPIYVLSVEDMIISKLGRFSQKDKEDIDWLFLQSDSNLVLDLYDSVLSRQDISSRVREDLLNHKKEFKERYYV